MQQENKAILESIRDYIISCPFLKEGTVNVDYLPDSMSYSIDPLPAEPLIRRYTDGGELRQFQFAFTSKEKYDGDARTGIDTSGFYQDFVDWIEANNKDGTVPELKKEKCHAQYMETLTSGYLFESGNRLARYQIQCRLIYFKEA